MFDSQRRNLPIKHRRPSYTATALCRDVQHRAKWGNPSAQSKRYRDRRIHVSTCVQKVFHIKRRKESRDRGRLRDSSLELYPAFDRRFFPVTFISVHFFVTKNYNVNKSKERNNCSVTRAIDELNYGWLG